LDLQEKIETYTVSKDILTLLKAGQPVQLSTMERYGLDKRLESRYTLTPYTTQYNSKLQLLSAGIEP
jgi:hypothetical protein